MTAMTPMKALVVDRRNGTVSVKDMADQIEPVCQAKNEAQLQWLIDSLSAYHKVPVEEINK